TANNRPTLLLTPANPAAMLPDAAGLQLSGGSSVVTGLAVGGFPRAGIELLGGSGNRIQGCFVGTDVTGTLARPNGGRGGSTGGAIIVADSATNTIGGLTTAARNVVSGN